MGPREEQKNRSARVTLKGRGGGRLSSWEMNRRGCYLGREVRGAGWRGGGQRELLRGGVVSAEASRLREWEPARLKGRRVL